MEKYKVGHMTVINGSKKYETLKAIGLAIVLAPILWIVLSMAIIAFD